MRASWSKLWTLFVDGTGKFRKLLSLLNTLTAEAVIQYSRPHTHQHNAPAMNTLYELRRVVSRAVDPADEDVTQLCGCYPTLDEADLAKDFYESRYPGSVFYIE